MQILVKTLLRHKEFGISAGRLSRSWRPTQRTKARRSARASDSREILTGDRMFEDLLVVEPMFLSAVKTPLWRTRA